MNSLAQDLMERKDRPPFVKFVRVAVDDPVATRAANQYVAKDVDFVHVTPAYSKDIFKAPVSEWFATLQNEVASDRFPQKWLEDFKTAYKAFQNGQEAPPNGSPIKGWGVISPAQQETLIRMNILTVEDLAAINDEGIRRVGMGGVDLKLKAQAWLDSIKSHGATTLRIAELESENSLLKKNQDDLQARVDELSAAVEKMSARPPAAIVTPAPETISASDLIEESDDQLTARYVKKFGNRPHHRMKRETIEEALRG